MTIANLIRRKERRTYFWDKDFISQVLKPFYTIPIYSIRPSWKTSPTELHFACITWFLTSWLFVSSTWTNTWKIKSGNINYALINFIPFQRWYMIMISSSLFSLTPINTANYRWKSRKKESCQYNSMNFRREKHRSSMITNKIMLIHHFKMKKIMRKLCLWSILCRWMPIKRITISSASIRWTNTSSNWQNPRQNGSINVITWYNAWLEHFQSWASRFSASIWKINRSRVTNLLSTIA